MSNATYGIDLSDDTKITTKAVFVLVGVDSNGIATKHVAISNSFFQKFVSGPGWTSYRYNANSFSPAINPTERLSSLALSLLGASDPFDHEDHWASRPEVNGIFLPQVIFHRLNVSNGSVPVTP